MSKTVLQSQNITLNKKGVTDPVYTSNYAIALDDLSDGGGGTSDYSELENKPQINGVTLEGNLSTDDLGIEAAPMIETTYVELKALRDAEELTPGMQYRITDYETIINGSYDMSVIGTQGYLHNAVSAGHPFDIIVTANDESHLNENARAARRSGDTYFNGANVEGWELKYTIDNDSSEFTWATSNGKGVIWWMKDEWNNQASYDFKNIQFLRYALKLADQTGDYTPTDRGLVYNSETQPNRYGGMYQIFTALQWYLDEGTYVNPYSINKDDKYDYDFAVGEDILNVIQFPDVNSTYLSTFAADLYYTFDYYDTTTGEHVDASLNGNSLVLCEENYHEITQDAVYVILQGEGVLAARGLGGNVWETNSMFVDENGEDNISYNHLSQKCCLNTFGNRCYSNTFSCEGYGNTFADYCNMNTFGNRCNNNIFGYECSGNTFKDSCYANTFGSECSGNIFGNFCHSNTFGSLFYGNIFGDGCYRNIFADECSNNMFGDYCYTNIFWENCSSNTFRDECSNNTFEEQCSYNTFGDKCDSNTFGYSCQSNTFGNSCNSNVFWENCRMNTFGNNCRSTFGDNCESNTLGDNCDTITFANSCSRNVIGYNTQFITFGDNCESNKLGNYCSRNTFGNNCQFNILGNSCGNNRFGNTDGNNDFVGDMHYLHCGDHVESISASSTQYGQSSSTIKTLENYDGVLRHATLIIKTGYNTETAMSTTDGGTTWS